VRRKLWLLTVFCAPLIGGCAHTERPQISEAPSNQGTSRRDFRSSDGERKPGCSIRILAEAPHEGARKLSTIRLAGRVPSEVEVIALVEQKACELGADAIFVRQIQQQSAAGQIDYQITAIAYVLDRDAPRPDAAQGQPPAEPKIIGASERKPLSYSSGVVEKLLNFIGYPRQK
jgi:hypothetical protein